MLNKNLNNVSGLQLFQLLRFGALLLINIAFAKVGLDKALIGSFEIFMFFSALVCSFWVNGIIQSFLPLYKNGISRKDPPTKSPEIFNAFLLLSAFSLLIVFIMVLLKNPLTNAFTSKAEIPFFNLILVYIVFNCPAFLVEYIYLLKNKPRKIVSYGVIIFSFQFLLVAMPAILERSFSWCIYGLVISAVGKYIWLLILLQKYALYKPSYLFISKHLKFAWPLMVSTLLGSSAIYVDDFLVLNKFDASTFAVFKYGAKEFPLVLLMVSALSNAMIAEFSDKNKVESSLLILKVKTRKLMHFLFPASIIMLLCSEWLYPLIFNDGFAESASIFNIYLLLLISRVIFPHPILIGIRKTNIVMYASFIELIFNISLSILFIGIWGLQGIAFATVLAYALQKIIWIVYLKKHHNIKPSSYIPVTELLVYSLIMLIGYTYVWLG